MLSKKFIGAALACALALGGWSGAALANPINVDGVVFNPDSSLNLNVQAVNFRETAVSQVGDVVTGYGQIGTINGQLDAQFCPNCDLTFTFQYTVSSINTTGATPHIVFDDGSINLYVQAANSFDPTNANSVNTSNLWLALTGHTTTFTGFVDANTNQLVPGELFATIVGTTPNPTNGSTGFGLLDATGGAAQQYADFNNIPDGMGGMADLSLSSDFQVDGSTVCAGSGASQVCYPISGTGSMIGHPTGVAVPEPGELGLLGLGLVALGFLIRRRRKTSDDRA